MSKEALESLSREELIALLRQERETFSEKFERHRQTKETLVAEVELHTETIRKLDRRREQLEHRLALVLKQLYAQRRERFIDPDRARRRSTTWKCTVSMFTSLAMWGC